MHESTRQEARNDANARNYEGISLVNDFPRNLAVPILQELIESTNYSI